MARLVVPPFGSPLVLYSRVQTLSSLAFKGLSPASPALEIGTEPP